MDILNVFADLLDYPDAGFAGRLGGRLAQTTETELVQQLLRDFEGSVNAMPPTRLEEIYTATFDLRPDCSLFVSYQLFGDDSRRGIFLIRLKEHYERHGFPCGRELPDHAAVILRFLAERQFGEEERDLIGECLLPAVTKVAAACETANPYHQALEALVLCLQNRSGKPAPDSAVEKPWTTCS